MTEITCIDVGGTYIKAGNVVKGKVKDERKVDTGEPRMLPRTLLKIIVELGGEAVGIGMPGLVDCAGRVSFPPNLSGIESLSIKEFLEGELNIPVFVDNDANMAALGEFKYGAGRGVENLIMLTLGTGVGGGIIIDGKVYHGRGYAGEVGHITINPDGPLCNCSNYGCLEAFIGSSSITHRAENYVKIGIKTTLKGHAGKITPKIIEDEANKGDSVAKDVVTEMGIYLGIAISNYCAVLDPEKIIIGGGLSKMGNILLESTKKEVQKRLYTRKDVDIVFGQLGDQAALLGCYEMVIYGMGSGWNLESNSISV
ncbi:ROK family protein [candidate division WOR-3 bacterium]|nr:ROK family protein [candidate division WOR-3 bacterium]